MTAPNRSQEHDTLLRLSLAEIAAWQVHKLLDPAFDVGQQPGCVARLPAFQRGAVWRQDQVELLWDSILRRFPIGALVFTPELQKQGGRLGKHSDKRWVESLSPTHHLLDGQQRANAIALGFYDPFHPEAGQEKDDKERAILWLDLAGPPAMSTRHFLFRLTTLAHPWGFKQDEAASPIEAKAMRDALVAYGWRKDDNTRIKEGRPTPRDAWPFKAEAPLPFAWVLRAAARSGTSEEFCRELLERCRATRSPWCDRVIAALQSSTNLDTLFAAVRDTLAARVPAFVVPDRALSGLSAQGTAKEGQDIASVEHLFQRLNAGGTVPSREEMAYSMIKAYWPEIEEPISQLDGRRMAEARLFMLGTRVALGAPDRLKRGQDELRKRLPEAPSVEAVRRIALQNRDPNTPAKHIHDFFTADSTDATHSPLLHLVMGRVKAWLEPGEDGLLPMLHSSVANRSPETYLLLMWLARRWTAPGSAEPTAAVRRPVLGLVTALHWFRPQDPALAAKLIAEELDQRSWDGPDLFRGLLHAVAGQDGNPSGLLLPPTPDDLMKTVGDLPDHERLKGWAWWRLARDAQNNETKETRSVLVVKDSRELLMYAQRDYTKGFDFDPAHARSEQHDRPWDYDHILPRSKVAGKHKETRPGLLEWVDSIANLRVWPMEENRSAQATCPKSKLAHAETGKLDQQALEHSFLIEEELNAFDRGCQNPFEEANARAFLEAAKGRLKRIYREWFEKLDIAFLTGQAEPSPPRAS